MKGFKKKPAVLPAAEPSAAKLAEDEAAPEAHGETSLEGGAKGSGGWHCGPQEKAGWKWAATLAPH